MSTRESAQGHDGRRGSFLGRARASWVERRDLHRRAPAPVRRYRMWSSLQSTAPGLAGVVTTGIAMSVPPPYGVFWAWSAGVLLGNAAFLVLMAVPPRRPWVHRVAWWYSVVWIVIAGLACVPLLTFAIPCFACICHKDAVAWFCDAPESDEQGPPRLPHHPWGYERAVKPIRR